MRKIDRAAREDLVLSVASSIAGGIMFLERHGERGPWTVACSTALHEVIGLAAHCICAPITWGTNDEIEHGVFLLAADQGSGIVQGKLRGEYLEQLPPPAPALDAWKTKPRFTA